MIAVFTDHIHLLFNVRSLSCFAVRCVLSRFDVSNDLDGEERADCFTFLCSEYRVAVLVCNVIVALPGHTQLFFEMSITSGLQIDFLSRSEFLKFQNTIKA